VGTGQTVYEIATVGGTATDCFIGAAGARLATKTYTSPNPVVGYTLYDLHGDIVGAFDASGAITDAFRFDAYGGTVDAWPSGGSSLNTAWRYQGRLLLSPTGAADLYEAGARFYSPGLGVFTQLDTYAGSAQNPISMNRYLYANADPATLVDPSGHCAGVQIGPMCTDIIPNPIDAAGNAGHFAVNAGSTMLFWPIKAGDAGIKFVAPGFQDIVVDHLPGPIRQGWDVTTSPVAFAEGFGKGGIDGITDVMNETIDSAEGGLKCATSTSCLSSLPGQAGNALTHLDQIAPGIQGTASDVWKGIREKTKEGDWQGAGDKSGHAAVAIVQIAGAVISLPSAVRAGLALLRSLPSAARSAAAMIRGLLPGATKEVETATDLYNFGNTTTPYLRIDMTPDGNGMIGPEMDPATGFPRGVSTFTDPQLADLHGPYWRLPAGTKLPVEVGLADDSAVAGMGHRVLYPTVQILSDRFHQLLRSLPWGEEPAGQIPRRR
jgi:RHS repeat-associated protein